MSATIDPFYSPGVWTVAPRMTFIVSGYAGPGTIFHDSGLLEIDQPHIFRGEIELDGNRAAVTLMNIGTVDTYGWQNDVLSLFDSKGRLVDALRLHNSTPFGFSLDQGPGGTSLVIAAILIRGFFPRDVINVAVTTHGSVG
jgi:hypothetical protein